MRVELKPCPFCGQRPEIVVGDAEGNVHDAAYADDPFSGLSYMLSHHNLGWACPVALHEGEVYPRLYDTPQEAAYSWNLRASAPLRETNPVNII